MRSVVALAFVAACGGAAVQHPGEARSLDAVIADAHAAGKPVVVEFGAPWCKPCRAFADTVLVRADVRAALAGVTFAYYDTGTDAGTAAAEHLGVADLPAFVALDAAGGVRTMRVGSAPTAEAFIAFVHAAATR
jgi:thiol:disulfide interchange protein